MPGTAGSYLLCTHYGISGTDKPYGEDPVGNSQSVQNIELFVVKVWHIHLRACFAMPVTDTAYGATRRSLNSCMRALQSR
eukprot:2687805-Rhodomonas_salina.2